MQCLLATCNPILKRAYFAQGLSKCAPPEQVVLACKSALRASLARLLVKNGVSSADKLLPTDSKRAGRSGVTLPTTVSFLYDSAFQAIRCQFVQPRLLGSGCAVIQELLRSKLQG
jgi:hypothetical protein